MYLLDTDVVSELRKGDRAHAGVAAFMRRIRREALPVYLSVITLGELRHGVEKVRRRGDAQQSDVLGRWLDALVEEFDSQILPFDEPAAQVWGRLMVPHADNVLDKQIAAIALVNDLTVATRNTAHFRPTGVRLENPFA